MKTVPIALLIVLSSALFSNGAIAQDKPLACQSEAAAGLMWENGRWVTKSFIETKFILVQTKEVLTTDSVAKAMGDPTDFGLSCRNINPEISCTTLVGNSLIFNPKSLKGGVAHIFGSTTADRDGKDTVTVKIFSCTPF